MKVQGKILLIDDDELIGSVLARALTEYGYVTRFETETANILTTIEIWYPDIILLDINLPGQQDGISILEEVIERGIDTKVIMITADNSVEMAVKALKLGAADYITKPFDADEVKIVIQNTLEKKRLQDEVACLRRDNAQAKDHVILDTTDNFRLVMERAATLAKAHVKTILITGESGTGKELLARHIHRLIHDEPHDSHAPFVTVNCTALPEHLFESELFGYVKGAFTDAKTDQKGLFELAVGGSILLDEIGDMKEALQAKLLRVLEERQVRRVGGKADLPVEVTVIATTNRNLTLAVEGGFFRQDLFYRLNTFPITIPPLRERKASILLFINHFLAIFAKKYNKLAIKAFSPEAERILCDYDWPGNVRELRNIIEQIVVLEQAQVIGPEHLPLELRRQRGRVVVERRKNTGEFILPDEGINLEELEKKLYNQALAKANNNMIKAAKLLQVSYDTFRFHAKKYCLLAKKGH